jgi:hypothetical protein
MWFNIAYSPTGLYAKSLSVMAGIFFLIKVSTQKKRVLTARRKEGKRNEIKNV